MRLCQPKSKAKAQTKAQAAAAAPPQAHASAPKGAQAPMKPPDRSLSANVRMEELVCPLGCCLY